MATGVSVNLWTSKSELVAVKNGESTTILASTNKSPARPFQIDVQLDACEFVGEEVRVNVRLIKDSMEEVGKVMGEAMGQELEKIFKALDQQLS